MKAIMLSIRPEWVEKILNGEKTIEIRKTKPSCELPVKVYIYCTKGRELMHASSHSPFDFDDEDWRQKEVGVFRCNGKVVAEFTLKEVDRYTAEFVDDDCYEDIRLYTENPYSEDIDDMYYEDIITTNEKDDPSDCDLCKQSCVPYEEIKKYVGVNWHDIPFYGWHIDDLKIYDKPKDISDFTSPDYLPCDKPRFYFPTPLKKPPQSWCYVDELGGKDE